MQISCDCGAFKAELTHVPKNTPGRLACYCQDCQNFMQRLGRPELLDEYGGTELVPVYPGEIRILQGHDKLVCNRVTPNGPLRWSTSCCNSPVGNMKPKFPWLGISHNAFRAADPDSFDSFGPVRCRIYGRDAKGQPPFHISDKIGFRDKLTVLPFLLKGLLTGKARGCPYLGPDELTPISPPRPL